MNNLCINQKDNYERIDKKIFDYDSSVMNYQDFVLAKSAFHQHYSSSQMQNCKGCVDVNYEALHTIVLQAFNGRNIDNAGLTFIHRFDTQTNEWFVCAEVCSIDPAADDDSDIETATGRHVRKRHPISASPRYDLRHNGAITISTMSNGYVDTDYFENIHYTETLGGNPVSLNILD